MQLRPSLALGALAALVLSACATPGASVPPASSTEAHTALPTSALGQHALQALRAGRDGEARRFAQEWVARDPRAGAGHLLLAMGHHLGDDASAVDLAASGYDVAGRHGADAFWPHHLSGVAAMQRQQPRQAIEHFARAVLADPDNGLGLEGLAAAAFVQGELPLARAAAQRAVALLPDGGTAWRTGLLAAAAAGDEADIGRWWALAPAGAAGTPGLQQRARQLLRTAQLEAAPSESSADPAAPADPPQQVTVDVVLILSDQRKASSLGLNLLEGLQLQFGTNRTTTGVIGESASTAITRSLRIPDLNYSLNIANRGDRRYHVLARPSLTAFSGVQSSFFVGEQLHVQVSGVNVAQIDKIDVGVTLKITPSEVRSDGTRFALEADRSFFSDPVPGSFAQQLTIFKQSVSATADVKFGQTLVLSGLSETVDDSTTSGVPVLGDIPGPNLLLNRDARLDRSRSVLILVTPSLPIEAARSDTRRSAVVEQLMRQWQRLIDPSSHLERVLENSLRPLRRTRTVANDVHMRDLRDEQVRAAVLAAIEPQLPSGTPRAR